MKKIIDETINKLIEKKNSLNFEIEEIIYDDMTKSLNTKDILELEEKRKEIKLCYDIVEYLDRISRGLKDE